MNFPSFNVLIYLAFAIYLFFSLWSIYGLYNPQQCIPGKHGFCVNSLIHKKTVKNWQLSLYTSTSKAYNHNSLELVKSWKHFDFAEQFEEELDVEIPVAVKSGFSLYYFLVLKPQRETELSYQYIMVQRTVAVKLTHPVKYFNLLEAADNKTTKSVGESKVPHFYEKLSINVMNQDLSFPHNEFPPELSHLTRFDSNRNYMPMLYVDKMARFESHLRIVPEEPRAKMKLMFSYKPISAGKLRLWITFEQSLVMLQELGFSDKDLDEVKYMFSDTKMYILMLTFAVSLIHVIFDFMAFKNDIKFWKGRETMSGMSYNTVLFRCVSQVIIFLYLCDNKTSLLVTAPAGVSVLIEAWKVKKALKVKVGWSGGSWTPHVQVAAQDEEEKSTSMYDQEAFGYLKYLLIPLCIASALYSLLYVSHRSMYSWVIESLVNGVYVFGFLFMLPQLFINYKLKSVAHLPWRAFMYKAFNTFIDDVFAFIIQMPTSHRLACFRDDIVFFCYLYQLWLYPVDKSRPNEYGFSYEHEKEEAKEKKE